MQQNTFPDGFPLSPLEAIEFSYTFTEEEKAEWRDWVKTATPEQQQELVDTLHAIWEENQKNVVPSGFEKKDDAIPTPATDVKTQTIEQALSNTPAPAPVIEESAPSVVADKTPENTTENVEQKIEPEAVAPKKDFVFNEKPEKSIVLEAVQPVVSPVLEAKQEVVQPQQTQRESRDIRQNQPQRDNRDSRQNQNPQQNRIQNQQRQNNQNPQQQEQRQQQVSNVTQQQNTTQTTPKDVQTTSFFDFAKAREEGSQKVLEQLQLDFVSARDKKMHLEKQYTEDLAKSVNEMEEKQFILIDKVIGIVLNFEQVSDYFETMTTKLLEMNDKVIELAKEVKSIKSDTEARVIDVRDDVDSMQRDVDRMYRDMKDMRIENRDKFRELSDQSSANQMDSFGEFGINQKLSILQSKVDQLQKNSQQPVKSNPLKQKKAELPESNVSKSAQTPSFDNQNTTSSNQKLPKKQESPVIDLREVV